MRICILTTLHAPDDDRIFYKEALSLRKAYGDITLVAPHGESCEDFRGSGIKLVALRPREGRLGRLLMLADAVRTVRGLAPDVCHFHDFDQIPLAPLLGWRRNMALVYDVHEAYPEQVLDSEKVPRPLRRAASLVIDRIEKRASRSCTLILSADDATRNTFLRLGLPARTIFNYPPLSLFPPPPPDGGVVPEHLRGRQILIYQGTMSANRGLFQMIEALRGIRESIPLALLLLVGLPPSPLREGAERRIRELGLSGSVEILGWIPHTELRRYIGCSAVGLVPWQSVPKHRMNIPIKLFEYWACAIPVVASDLPSYRDYVLRAGGGLLYDPAKTEDLISAVVALLKDEDLRRQMGQRGFEKVRDEWNWDAMERFLLSSYRELEAGSCVGHPRIE